MTKRFFGVILVGLCVMGSAGAGWGLELVRGVVTSGIQEREPADDLYFVSTQVGKVYCFTQVADAQISDSETSVVHVWTFKGEEMARVILPVRASHWRTWSSKKLVPEWRGAWKVDILDPQGNLLKSIPFEVE